MKYRDILGFSKPKKKVIKEQSKPKKNKILESVKKELNEWHHAPPSEKRWSKDTFDTGLTEFEQRGGKDVIKEVGVAQEHKKFIKNIEKAEENMHKHIALYKNFLMKQGHKKEAMEFSSNYITMIGKFTHWMKTKWVRIVRNLI